MNLLTYLTCLLLQTTTPTWQTYKTTPEVDVLFRTEQCHDEANGMHREYILLKLVNKVDYDVNVEWQLERYANNTCSTCANSEYKYKIRLLPNETKEANCQSDKALKIFVKHLDLPNHETFTKFELGNLTISKTYVLINKSW